jgi:hypothetical protein
MLLLFQQLSTFSVKTLTSQLSNPKWASMSLEVFSNHLRIIGSLLLSHLLQSKNRHN